MFSGTVSAESVLPVLLGMSGNIFVAALMNGGMLGGGVSLTEELNSEFLLLAV